MKYNLTIKNDEPLPHPYAIVVGDTVQVTSLSSGRPLFVNAKYITGSESGQAEIHCVSDEKHYNIIMALVPGIVLLYANNTETSPDA